MAGSLAEQLAQVRLKSIKLPAASAAPASISCPTPALLVEQLNAAGGVKGEKIKLVPVVAFYGPNGQRLADPIVGARLPDFYQSYLETAVEQSITALKAKSPSR